MSFLEISPALAIPLDQIELTAIRSQGAGGQKVNKTSSAIHLRFDAAASSLPEDVKARLLARRDQRIGDDGVVVIKAQQFRRQEQNREAALERLRTLVQAALVAPVSRKATKPSKAARRRRVDDKVHRGKVKALRGGASDG